MLKCLFLESEEYMRRSSLITMQVMNAALPPAPMANINGSDQYAHISQLQQRTRAPWNYHRRAQLRSLVAFCGLLCR